MSRMAAGPAAVARTTLTSRRRSSSASGRSGRGDSRTSGAPRGAAVAREPPDSASLSEARGRSSPASTAGRSGGVTPTRSRGAVSPTRSVAASSRGGEGRRGKGVSSSPLPPLPARVVYLSRRKSRARTELLFLPLHPLSPEPLPGVRQPLVEGEEQRLHEWYLLPLTS